MKYVYLVIERPFYTTNIFSSKRKAKKYVDGILDENWHEGYSNKTSKWSWSWFQIPLKDEYDEITIEKTPLR